MENRKQIPIIALAVFSIVMLLAYGNINKIYALETSDKSITSPQGVVSTSFGGNSYFVAPSFATDDISVYNAADGSLFVTIDTTSAMEKGDWVGNIRAIDCSSSTCYFEFDTTAGTGNLDQVGKADLLAGTAQRVFNFTNNSAGTLIEMFNGKIYVANIIAGAYHLIELTIGAIPYTSFDRGDIGFGANLISFYGATISTVNYLAMSGSTVAGLRVWNLDSNTLKCSSAVFKGLHTGIYNNQWYVGTDAGTVRVLDNTCALISTIAAADLCGAGYVIQTVIINSAKLFVGCDNASTLNSMTYFNLTSSSKVITYSCGYNSAWQDSMIVMAYVSAFDVLACSLDGANIVRILWQGESGTPFNPSSNEVNGFCGNGTLRDCLGDSSALSGLLPANQNVTSVATTICQAIGFCDPNNENAKTNGSGLFLMLITGTFFAIALMSTVHTLNMRGYISASVKEIDPIFWLFLVVGVVSVSWYLDWIDDIVFAAMTVGLAGLVAFGVLKHFGRI